MSQRQFITIRSEKTNEEVDLELPGDQRIADLLPDLLKALNWPAVAGQHKLIYELKTEQGEPLDLKRSFTDQGIENFDVLEIALDETPSERSKNTGSLVEQRPRTEGGMGHGFESLTSSEPSPQDRRGTLAPPIWTQIPIDGPSLILTEKAMIFVIGKLPAEIGRRTRDHQPDIDLSEVDSNFLASRKHAQIIMSAKGLAIKPYKTKNGLFLNNSPLNPDEVYPLKDGDSIQFGFRGVQLIFRT